MVNSGPESRAGTENLPQSPLSIPTERGGKRWERTLRYGSSAVYLGVIFAALGVEALAVSFFVNPEVINPVAEVVNKLLSPENINETVTALVVVVVSAGVIGAVSCPVSRR